MARQATQAVDYGNLAELVESIDPTLELVGNLHVTGTSCLSLRVRRGQVDYVLKVRRRSRNLFEERYFSYEIKALRRSGERKIPGVTRLIEEIQTDEYLALLKEYVHGTPGNNMNQDELYDNPDFVRRLDKLYLRLHIEGIANILFQPRKIVITDADNFTLIDLHTCLVHTEIGVNQFNLVTIEDSQFINQLERRLLKKGIIKKRLHA